MPHDGSRRRQGPTCRCPDCDYEFTIEEGEKCERFECPRCKVKLREKK